MKGRDIYFFLLGFQLALGIIYVGDTFFAGNSNGNDATSNVEKQEVSSAVQEDDNVAVKAARIFLGGGVPDVSLSGTGVPDVNLSGSSTTAAAVKEKTDQKKETVNKDEDVEKTKKNLRSDTKKKNVPLGPGGLPLDETYRRSLQVEQHFMVDWTQYYTEEEFTKLMKEEWPNLEIRKMVTHPAITNDLERQTLMSKFYMLTLAKFQSSARNQFKGATPFNMYYINDTDPKYDMRPSNRGKRLVNTSMFDFKLKLRNDMGGEYMFKVHATDNIQETKYNMKALGSRYTIRKFDTLRQLFDVLNFSGLEYVVLRNYEKMPDEVNIDPNHLDVDILVSDYYDAKRILDGDSPARTFDIQYENGFYRVMNNV